MKRCRLPYRNTGVGDRAARNLVALPRGPHILEQQHETCATLIDLGEIYARDAAIDQRSDLPVKFDFLAIQAEHRGGPTAGCIRRSEFPGERRRVIPTRKMKADAVAHLPGPDGFPAQIVDLSADLRTEPRSAYLIRMCRKICQAPLPQEAFAGTLASAERPDNHARGTPMNGTLEWITSIGTVLAASMIAFDMGRRATAWGFVLFCAVSALWIYIGLTEDALPLAAMNGVLLLINAWGVYQYWIHPKNRN